MPGLDRMVSHERLNLWYTDACAWNVKSELHTPLMKKQNNVSFMWVSLKRKHNKNSHLKLMKGVIFKKYVNL